MGHCTCSQVNLSWARGTLVAERHGICICPNDLIAHATALTVCTECLMMPGHALRGVMTHRRLPALGFHFQDWKKVWSRNEYALLRAHNGVRPVSVVDPVPNCVASSAFRLAPEGFACGAH